MAKLSMPTVIVAATPAVFALGRNLVYTAWPRVILHDALEAGLTP